MSLYGYLIRYENYYEELFSRQTKAIWLQFCIEYFEAKNAQMLLKLLKPLALRMPYLALY